jgi:hypothetical protein
LPGLFGRPLAAAFDQPQAISDGGAVLLTAAWRQRDLTDGFADPFLAVRQPEKGTAHPRGAAGPTHLRDGLRPFECDWSKNGVLTGGL